MCGIFGYVGPRTDAAAIVLNGLKALEYRGYDSWGVAVVPVRSDTSEKTMVVKKKAGKIGAATVNDMPQSSFGFGHTRWATHGGVTDVNAHPHVSCDGNTAVVHNGIIENYLDIKKLLRGSHAVVSDTDTELAAHLIEEYREHDSFPEAVRRAFLTFRGLSAFLVADRISQTLVAVKSGPPLALGVGKGEYLVGSDANALLPLTRNIIFLEDDQMATLSRNTIEVIDTKTRKSIPPKIQQISWKQPLVTKEHYPHFMLKEIHEIPKVLGTITVNFDERIAHFARLVKRSPRIYMIGCGTAYYAGLSGAYLLSKIAQKEVTPISGSEFVYSEQFLGKDMLAIFLSQSGETIDVIEPLKRVKGRGVQTAAIVNAFGSSLYRLSEEKIWLEAGPEIAVATTKAFVAKVAVLGLVAFSLVGETETGKNLFVHASKEIKKILDVRYQARIRTLANILKRHEHVFVIGRGLNFPLALETALKIKEEAYIHAEGFSGGELKHGSIALIENGTPCIVLASLDETYEATLSNAMEVKARGGYVIGLSEKKEDVFDFHLPVAECGVFTSLPQAVVAQCLAYNLALLRGYDPDKPRNLAKSVTVK